MPSLPDFGDHIDNEIFSQILEMDEEDSHDFSRPLIDDFFEQADRTFVEMDSAVGTGNLHTLSQLGHFLKGSSATLGFSKVRDGCQIIQQYGNHQNLDGTLEPDEKVCMKKISDALANVKNETATLRKLLGSFFNMDE